MKPVIRGIVRQEQVTDIENVSNLIERAFRDVDLSDHDEHKLVARLRASEAFIPELSLVYEVDDTLLGHILMSQIKIVNDDTQWSSLSLAPVSVLPQYQGRKIGSQLIKTAHRVARDLGFTSILLLGHKDYYPRFGYKPMSQFNISLPFEAPDEYCMAIELEKNALKGVVGRVVYPPEFFIP